MDSSGDRAVPNLPARDLGATSRFHGALGFVEAYRSDDCAVLRRGPVQLEFFGFAALDPWSSSFCRTLRLADLDGFCALVRVAGVPVGRTGFPRLHLPRVEDRGGRVAHLQDPDGTQLSLVERA